MKNTNHYGFTIMELMIATAVFSIVLIAAQASFTQIGKLFYKGVSVTSTQNSATHILSEVKTSIQTASTIELGGADGGSGYTYFCLGSNRYTFNQGHELDLSSNETYNPNGNGNYGILEDNLSGNTTCADPCNPSGNTPDTGQCQSGDVAFDSQTSKELLGNKMRVEQFAITQPDSSGAPNLYQIDLVIAYGDDSTLAHADNPDTVACQGSLNTQSFCFVSRLSAFALRGVSG